MPARRAKRFTRSQNIPIDYLTDTVVVRRHTYADSVDGTTDKVATQLPAETVRAHVVPFVGELGEFQDIEGTEVSLIADMRKFAADLTDGDELDWNGKTFFVSLADPVWFDGIRVYLRDSR